MNHAFCYRPGYPRIQFVRNSFSSLNGKWGFCFLENNFNIYDASNESRNFKNEYQINVPYCFEAKNSGINVDVNKATNVVGYQRIIEVEKIEENVDSILNFEAVDYECALYVNHMYVGNHLGGYTRFSFNITPFIKVGQNVITLFVVDKNESDKPRGKQTWMDGPFGCWYKKTTGIWKSVWMENVSHTRLSSVLVTPCLESTGFNFEYDIANYEPGMNLEIKLNFHGKSICDVSLAILKEHGNIIIDARNPYEAFKIQMWTTNCPHIFDIEYILKKDNVILDQVYSYTAYKKFEANNNMFYLNRNQTFLKMILFQGYYPNDGLTPINEKDYIDVIDKCKKIGLNGIRVHQKIEDELFYYYCDVMGLMVFLETPSPYEFTSRTIERLTKETLEIVSQFQNHPSIIAYVPINESWGVPQIYNNDRQQKFASSLYYLIKSMDPSRLVIDNDGWEHTENTDIISLHNYDQNPNTLKELYEDIEGVITDSHQLLRKQSRPTMAFGKEYKGQPIMLDEFVGTMIESGTGWGYGSNASNKDAYFERIKQLITCIQQNPYIAGYCITQFNDTYQEKNGLFDENFEPKIPLEKYNEIISEEKIY